MTTTQARAGTLRVGMIGYGFMGAAHSHAWRTAHRFFDLPLTPELRTLAGRTESAVAEAAERFGFASWTTRRSEERRVGKGGRAGWTQQDGRDALGTRIRWERAYSEGRCGGHW